jgi:hypothetical protein
MRNQSIEHLENLIRVVSNVPDDKFDLSHCHHCAMGHASRDEYFVAHGFKPGFPSMEEIRDFFATDMRRVSYLFFRRSGYESRHDVLAALRVLLLEKMAHDIGADIGEGELQPSWIAARELELAE